MTNAHSLQLQIPGFDYNDLFDPNGLQRLHQAWLAMLAQQQPDLYAQYQKHLVSKNETNKEAYSDFLCQVAASVSAFVVQLFGEEARQALHVVYQKTQEELQLLHFKDQFIKRRVAKRAVPVDAETALQEGLQLLAKNGIFSLTQEQVIAGFALGLLDEERARLEKRADDTQLQAVRAQLDVLADCLLSQKDTLVCVHHWKSFQAPKMLDYQNLVPLRRAGTPNDLKQESVHYHARDGFGLTDPRMTSKEVLKEVDYCLYCHDRDKDSCSKGLHDKTGTTKKNPLDVLLSGCPLEEKISEMHFVRRQGDPIAALALICLDNPMCPGTGHRICNDCMKSCIYQKQEPVNIPQTETGILTEVLRLPWGVEIYGLLTRWNPLNLHRPYPLPYRGRDVLVVGLGPAGYTLAHYLSREGFGVVGIDGLKLEPPPQPYSGNAQIDQDPMPLLHYSEIEVPLETRPILGFGGVSEYGITARWDKNFLTLLYMTLSRYPLIRFYGGVRFGGTLTLEDAWQLGFDHVALATGAGSPTLLSVSNNLVTGMRQASDFLMSLQLGAAYKQNSLTNLQVRLPALVIGGGLTAIDTATECLAYYVSFVEKILQQWEDLYPNLTLHLEQQLSEEEKAQLAEYVQHGRAIRQERTKAQQEKRPPEFAPLLKSWGGVTIVYRKRLQESPAYRLNHEEVEKGLEEGVWYAENLTPLSANVDAFGSLASMVFAKTDGETAELPARTVLVAIGTKPNTSYEQEHPHTFLLQKNGYFSPHRAERKEGYIQLDSDPRGVFTSYQQGDHTVGFYGDGHPYASGSVVKAMASAKRGFLQVAALYPPKAKAQDFFALCKQLDAQLQAVVYQVKRLTPSIVEVVVRAPKAASMFRPGQFYRLQSFESTATQPFLMEGLALTGADVQQDLLSFIVLEMGGSSNLCQVLHPNQPVLVMGPTGTPTDLPKNQTVCLVGGGLGNAVLFSIGQALKQNGCRVLYFAGYRRMQDLFKQEAIEACADQIVWAFDENPGAHFQANRPQDIVFAGNLIQAMLAYAQGEIGNGWFPFSHIERMIAIGSDRLMHAVQKACSGELKHYLSDTYVGIASINSPMQCMMKGICAQCLQRQVDPRTGVETFVYSCINQDQELNLVDFKNLADRLRQNALQEKISRLWLAQHKIS